MMMIDRFFHVSAPPAAVEVSQDACLPAPPEPRCPAPPEQTTPSGPPPPASPVSQPPAGGHAPPGTTGRAATGGAATGRAATGRGATGAKRRDGGARGKGSSKAKAAVTGAAAVGSQEAHGEEDRPAGGDRAAGASAKRRRTPPEPVAACGVGTSYAAFKPLRRDVNEPQPADDPFGESFAACDEDWWQHEDEDQASAEGRELQMEDEAESWAYDSVDTACLSEEEEEEVISASPGRAADDPFHTFLSRRRRAPKELKAVYTGPQLVLDDDDDIESPRC